jgi:hypothetical protein
LQLKKCICTGIALKHFKWQVYLVWFYNSSWVCLVEINCQKFTNNYRNYLLVLLLCQEIAVNFRCQDLALKTIAQKRPTLLISGLRNHHNVLLMHIHVYYTTNRAQISVSHVFCTWKPPYKIKSSFVRGYKITYPGTTFHTRVQYVIPMYKFHTHVQNFIPRYKISYPCTNFIPMYKFHTHVQNFIPGTKCHTQA